MRCLLLFFPWIDLSAVELTNEIYACRDRKRDLLSINDYVHLYLFIWDNIPRGKADVSYFCKKSNLSRNVFLMCNDNLILTWKVFVGALFLCEITGCSSQLFKNFCNLWEKFFSGRIEPTSDNPPNVLDIKRGWKWAWLSGSNPFYTCFYLFIVLF